MASNHKLTGVLKGRAVRSLQQAGSVLTLGFDDGSTMTVKTAGAANPATATGTVQAVRQQGTRLDLDFEGRDDAGDRDGGSDFQRDGAG